MMVTSVPPKAGRLATGSYGPSPIIGNVFKRVTSADSGLPVIGGVSMPNDRTTTVYRHPNARLRNTATQVNYVAKTNGVATLPGQVENSLQPDGKTFQVREIGPHEHGKFWRTTQTPVIKTQFGASGRKSSDTAFHPKAKIIIDHNQPVSQIAGERVNVPSFTTNNNLWADPNNSFLNRRTNTNGQGQGTGRWNTTKRSVV